MNPEKSNRAMAKFQHDQQKLLERMDRQIGTRQTKAETTGECFRCTRTIYPNENIVRRVYGDYHRACYQELCRKGGRILAISLVLFVFSLPLFTAEQLHPKLACGLLDEAHAICEMRSYFGAIQPKWEVYLGDRLVAEAHGLKFEPVIDTEWRILTASVPAKGGKAIFEVAVRYNPETGKGEFLARKGLKAVYEPHPLPLGQMASREPP